MLITHQQKGNKMTVVIEVMIWALILFAWGVSIAIWFEVLRTPRRAFRRAGQDKKTWLIAIFFLGLFASLPYLVFIRPNVVSMGEINVVRDQSPFAQ